MCIIFTSYKWPYIIGGETAESVDFNRISFNHRRRTLLLLTMLICWAFSYHYK